MAGRFYFLGSAGTGAASLSFPLGDGNPDAVTINTITLPTSASAIASAFTGLAAFVYSGSGVGQSRNIKAYSTARVATIQDWEQPRPDTGSYIVYGVAMRHADMAHYRCEYSVSTATTGVLRSEIFADAGGEPRRIFSQPFQNARVQSTAALSSTGDAHAETTIIDLMPLDVVLSKVFIETVPTAGTLELYVAPGKSHGRGN